MKIRQHCPREVDALGAFFTSVFADSEGADEGRIVGKLAADLVAKTPDADLYGFVAEEDAEICGCILFSRMSFESGLRAFLLAPVGVATSWQRHGVGQRMIRHGLDVLRANDIQLAMTYGDPRYYGRFGFEWVSEEQIAAPYPLSQPSGWLAQMLDGSDLSSVSGECGFVSAFMDPAYW